MENALPTLLVRNGISSPAMVRKTASSSAWGKAADRKKQVIVDIVPEISQSRFSTLGSRANKMLEYNEDDVPFSPRLSPMSSHIPQAPRMRNKILASLNPAMPRPASIDRILQEQKEKKSASHGSEKANVDTFAGRPYMDNVMENFTTIKSQQRRRSISSVPGEKRPRFTVESVMAKTFKAAQKSAPSFNQVEQKLQDKRDEKSQPNRNLKQLPPQMQTSAAVNHPTVNSYAKFKQRRETQEKLNCPLDTAKDAQGLFDWYAEDGILDRKGFRNIVAQMLNSAGQDLSEEDMELKIEVSWREADRNYRGKVDFDEFAIWYSSWGFAQELLLSPTKIRTRDLTRKYGLSIAEVDTVHSMFEFFDEDGSGEIEFDEFEKLLYKLMKVPKHAELPASRLQHFWKQIDIDGSGSVCFEEFLQWYIKYFDLKGTSNISPMEQFYRSVRPNHWRYTEA